MKGKLKENDKLDSLIQTQNLQSFISLLNETDYASYLENSETEPIQIEWALKAGLADACTKIYSIAPENVSNIFQELGKIVTIENINILLSSKFVKKSGEDIEERLLPEEFLSEEVYEKVLKAEDLDKALAAFEETEYWEAINEVLSEVEEEQNLLPLWTRVEQKFWEDAIRKAQNSSAKGSEVIREAIGMKIDIMNILTVLRCLNQNTEAKEIEKNHIPIYSKIEGDNLERTMEMEDVKEAVVNLEDSYYGEKLSEALEDYRKTGSIYSFEKSLYEFFIKKMRTMSIQNSAGAGPLTAFFFRKRMEVRNLITITNGISENLSSEKINGKLIMAGKNE
uniref:V-type ATP synthase subunit C n=1 Tax=uncultured organism TaxID=155900 RepID=M1P2C9_9ZZZZ|nr:V-type ATP synthase subunit C [uncultured organism]